MKARSTIEPSPTEFARLLEKYGADSAEVAHFKSSQNDDFLAKAAVIEALFRNRHGIALSRLTNLAIWLQLAVCRPFRPSKWSSTLWDRSFFSLCVACVQELQVCGEHDYHADACLNKNSCLRSWYLPMAATTLGIKMTRTEAQ